MHFHWVSNTVHVAEGKHLLWLILYSAVYCNMLTLFIHLFSLNSNTFTHLQCATGAFIIHKNVLEGFMNTHHVIRYTMCQSLSIIFSLHIIIALDAAVTLWNARKRVRLHFKPTMKRWWVTRHHTWIREATEVDKSLKCQRQFEYKLPDEVSDIAWLIILVS